MAHPEENSLSSPNAAIIAADLRYTNPEQNPSVSYDVNVFLPVTDNQQAQQSMSGFFANAQNTLVTGGSFVVVGFCRRGVCDFITNSMYRTIFSLLMLAECRLKSL